MIGDYCSEDNNILKFATAWNSSGDLVISNIQNVTELQGISEVVIQHRKIPVICVGSLKDLPPLKRLAFYDDGIHEIQPGAFGNQLNVEELSVTRNNISTIKKGVFNGLKTREIDLSGNNIVTIEKGAFDDMPELTTVWLNGNNLTQIDSDWFSGKTLFPILACQNKLFQS